VFKGKTEFTLDYSSPEKLSASKAERHFYQRMLRAYLKGKETFSFGRTWNAVAMRWESIQYKVLCDFE
jgi:hypothetical protein